MRNPLYLYDFQLIWCTRPMTVCICFVNKSNFLIHEIDSWWLQDNLWTHMHLVMIWHVTVRSTANFPVVFIKVCANGKILIKKETLFRDWTFHNIAVHNWFRYPFVFVWKNGDEWKFRTKVSTAWKTSTDNESIWSSKKSQIPFYDLYLN